jgi:DNA repair protein RecN (Recombination protein N)
MLLSLSLKNLAIVEAAHLDFESGMTAITGETGVGKSILIDGLLLVLGGRSDSQMIGPASDRAEVIAEFDLSRSRAAQAWLKERELDEDASATLLIRRVLTKEGRSRNFINGRAVTAGELKSLAETLVEIHAQHEHHRLSQRSEQIAIFDGFAGCERAELAELYDAWRATEREIQSITEASDARAKAKQLLDYQLEELEALQLTAGEYASLSEDQTRLSHADETRTQLADQLHRLTASDENLTDELRRILVVLHQLKDPNLAQYLSPIESAVIQLEEGARDLERYVEQIESQPERLKEIENRLERILDLSRKHHCSPEQLLETWEQLETERSALSQTEADLSDLRLKRQSLETQWQAQAQQIQKRRQASVKPFQRTIEHQLQALGMADAKIKILLTPNEGLNPVGLEIIDFQISTNPGQAFGPIQKIASGGELSRISLAIQVARAASQSAATLVFDEVDVGIGGRVAETVGHLLAQLGQDHQILCVTHLGQVAAQARHHLRVSKSGKPVATKIEALDGDTRVEEIARMMGGAKLTQATLTLAKEMISLGQSA